DRTLYHLAIPARALLILADFTLAQADLALTVDIQDLDHDFVPFSEHVAHASYATGPELGNVHKTVGPRQDLDERAEVYDLPHRAFVDLTDLRHFRPRRGKRLGHLVEDMQPAFPRLVQSLLHDLARDSDDLNIHLQGGDTLGSARDLEVHVAEMVFIAKDVA